MQFETDEISFESLDETHALKNLSSKRHIALHLISFQSRETAGKLIS